MVLLRIVSSIVRMLLLLLLSLCVRRNSFPIKTTITMIHGIGSIMAMKLLVRIVTSRVVVLVLILHSTAFSSIVGPGALIGRKVGRIILVLSVSIGMMIHHQVMLLMITSMVIIVVMLIRSKPVVYVVKVSFIPIISIVSIVMIGHADMVVLIIKLLHVFTAGVVVAIVGLAACGVVASVVNLRFACLNFAVLTEDVQYARFPWDVIKEGVCHLL